MSLATGGLAFGATSTRSRSASRARSSALRIATMPTCSPFGPTRRTSGTLILSLIRGSLMCCSFSTEDDSPAAGDGKGPDCRCRGGLEIRLRDTRRNASVAVQCDPEAALGVPDHRKRSRWEPEAPLCTSSTILHFGQECTSTRAGVWDTGTMTQPHSFSFDASAAAQTSAGAQPPSADPHADASAQAVRDIAEVPAVEVISTAAVHL